MKHVNVDCSCRHGDDEVLGFMWECPRCQGLFVCAVCGGAEAELPTECPGVQMTLEEKEAVQGRQLDFRDGSWKYPGLESQEDKGRFNET